MRFNRLLLETVFRRPDDGTGAGADDKGGKADPPADPASLLFPKDAPKADDKAADDKGGKKEDGTVDAGKKDEPGKGDDKAADWKEYVDDPAKSAEENARLKAEHDAKKPKVEDKDKKADDAADKVPDDGKYDLKMPEGVELDADLANEVMPAFKELGLKPSQAQKLTDKYVEVMQKREIARHENWAKTVTKWADDAKADTEMGGDKWDGTLADARRAVDKLGTPAFREYLDASGGGNHPEAIRFMAKVGAMIKEDNPANGGADGKGRPAEAAHLLFPNDKPKGT